jgi:hypothetical protein
MNGFLKDKNFKWCPTVSELLHHLATKRQQCLYVIFYRVPTVTMTFGFEYFPWITSHQKLPGLHFFKVKINNSFEMFI